VRDLAGLMGYVTNLAACPDGTPVAPEFVIGSYHELWNIEGCWGQAVASGCMRRFRSWDGTELAYRAAGSGPPLVCVPGGPGQAAEYLGDLGELTGYRTLILLDNRGTGASHAPQDPVTYRVDRLIRDVEAPYLPRGSGFELDHEFRGHPSAVLHFDALRLGPLADLGAVHPIRPRAASATGRPPGTGPCPPCRLHIARECVPQRPSMPGVQVDLILGAVQSEADGALSLAAIKVIDKHGLDLLGHNAAFHHWLHLPG